MRTWRKLAVVLVVAGMAGACAAVPASADTAAPTAFGFRQVNQGLYNYTDQTITLSGALWDVAVTPNTAIAGEPVTVTEQVAGTGSVKDVGSAMTGADGSFTITLTDQPVGGIFRAVFGGDTSNGNDYAATTSPPLEVAPEFPSDVDADYTANPKSPVTTGSTVTFSGTVFVPADDGGGTNPKTPIVGAHVYVFSGSAYTATSAHATTGKNGTFSVSVKPTATTAYNVEVVANEPFPYSLYVYGSGFEETTITVRNPRQTRIESFQVPATHEIHGNFDPSGTVQELNGTKWQAAPSATVALFDRSLPSGKWVYVGSVKAGSSGAFAWKYQIYKLGRFAWQARVEQTTVGSTEYKASDSAAKNSHFVDRTYVTEFVVLHLYGDTSIGAVMEDYPQSGGAHYTNVTGIAKFYYEPTGSKSWRYLGESRATNANPGSVAVEPVGTLDGTFKIIFPAQGDFLGSGRLPRLKRHALPHLTSRNGAMGRRPGGESGLGRVVRRRCCRKT